MKAWIGGKLLGTRIMTQKHDSMDSWQKRYKNQTKYRKVASSKPVYYSKVTGLRPKVTVHKDQISPSKGVRKSLAVLLTETCSCSRLYVCQVIELVNSCQNNSDFFLSVCLAKKSVGNAQTKEVYFRMSKNFGC